MHYPILCFLDIETTGLSMKTDEIIEIGVLKVYYNFNGEEEKTEIFHTYINPVNSIYIDPKVEAVHGLSIEFLRDYPTIDKILGKFLDFIENHPIVMHNVSFDWNFIQRDLKNNNLPFMLNQQICTLAMARKYHTNTQCSLNNLCKIYGVSVWHRTLHGALIDANITKEIYYILSKSSIKPLSKNLLKESRIKGSRPIRYKKIKWDDYINCRLGLSYNNDLSVEIRLTMLKLLISSLK